MILLLLANQNFKITASYGYLRMKIISINLTASYCCILIQNVAYTSKQNRLSCIQVFLHSA
jgi:hypothetical protein